MRDYILQTPRLGLRNWIEEDREPFALMGQDPDVMKFFPSLILPKESAKQIEGFAAHYAQFGFTYFAVDELETGTFIGFTGLKHQSFESPFTPCVDIGWRLKKSVWGRGFASEAANACLDLAFGPLNLEEVFAFCPAVNLPSESVMKRIGMTCAGSFEHPSLEKGTRLRECKAYRKSAN
jgi:RimJ/RimL family protein N-acetyltransferase